MIGASGAVTAVVTLFTLYHPKREILFMFIPMPMWMVLTIFLVLPLLNILSGGSSHVAVEAHLAGAGFAFLFKQFDLRWSRLVSGRLHGLGFAFSRLSRASRADLVRQARPDPPQASAAPRVPRPCPCSPRNNSMPAWTKCSPRSRERAAPA